jgi:hypothetical protein
MLFLLAAKSAPNRELVARLQRTTVAPLAQQLENAGGCGRPFVARKEGGGCRDHACEGILPHFQFVTPSISLSPPT